MKLPRIVSFEALKSKKTYTQQNESGLYKDDSAAESQHSDVGHHLADFMEEGIKITSVKTGARCIKVGSKFQGIGTINKITSKKGSAIFTTQNGTEYTEAALEAELNTVRAAAVAAPKPEPVKKNSADLKVIENRILAIYPEKIRLRGVKKNREESKKEFMLKFFKKFNIEKETIIATSKEVHTDTGRRRSLGDIFMIMKYYYPDITLAEVMNLLQVQMPKELAGFRTSMCNTIKKRVYYYDPSKSTEVCNKDSVDEYGNTYGDYQS